MKSHPLLFRASALGGILAVLAISVIFAALYMQSTLERDREQSRGQQQTMRRNTEEMLWLGERIMEDQARGIPAPWAADNTVPTHDPAWRTKIIRERGYVLPSQFDPD